MNTDVNTMVKEAEMVAGTISFFWICNALEVMEKNGVSQSARLDFLDKTIDELSALKDDDEYTSAFTKSLLDASAGKLKSYGEAA